MEYSKILLLLFSLICASANDTNDGIGKRVLMSFKETPSGSNVTFECSPSGPCVACAFSEKRDDKYRCSETGYRIPMKCVELTSEKKEANVEKAKRNLPADTSKSDHKSQAYMTYRSCITAVNEEKLSLVNFEGIMLILLSISGSFIYLRRKQNNSPSANGALRIPTSSRF